MTMKHLLFVNPCADIGGAEMSLLALLGGLNQNHYHLSLLLPEEGEVAVRANALGVNVRFMPMHNVMPERRWASSLRDMAQATGDIGRYRQVMETLAVDLIHINSYRIGVPVTLAARRIGRPTVWHLREIPRTAGKRRLVGALCRLPDRVVTISAAVTASLGLIGQPRTVQIYNAVDDTPFHSVVDGRFRQTLNLPPEALLLCSVGQLIPQKGYDFLIRAFARLADDPRLYLVIVGDNVSPVWANASGQADYRQMLRNLVEEEGITGRVIFTGFRSDVPQILHDIDVYVHAAASPEPFGRVMAEAQIAGKRVVAPRWGGIPEIVPDDVTVGFLFQPQDEKDFVRQLRTALAADPAPALQAAPLAQKRFSVEKHVAQMSALYEDLLAE
jgi:glycosyltransferase involved in cell wall biosynthesis